MSSIEAYEPPPPNDWVRPVVVGWAVFMGVFGAWGWLAADGYSAEAFISACVSLFSCVMLLNASVQMRRAGAKAAHRAGLVWLMALGLFGSWSGYSAHHAFEVSQGGAVEITSLWTIEAAQSAFLLIFFLGSAWIDPWLMWAVEETERAPDKPKEINGPLDKSEPKPKGSRAHLRTIVGGLTGAVSLASGPSAQAHEPGSFPTEPVRGPSPVSQKMSQAHLKNLDDPNRATAKLMIRQGQGPAVVHKATGVPLSTLKRWARAA